MVDTYFLIKSCSKQDQILNEKVGPIAFDHLGRGHRELLDGSLCRPDSKQWP